MVCGEKPSHQQTAGGLQQCSLTGQTAASGRLAVPAALLPQRLLEPPSPSSPPPSLLQRIRFPRDIETFSRNCLPFPTGPHLAAPAPTLTFHNCPLGSGQGGALPGPASVFGSCLPQVRLLKSVPPFTKNSPPNSPSRSPLFSSLLHSHSSLSTVYTLS